MSDAFTQEASFAGFMFDMNDAGWSGVPVDNYLGVFPRGEGPVKSNGEPEVPSGDRSAPAWFVLWEMGQPITTAMYADDGRGRRYDVTFDVFSDPERAQDLFLKVGPQIVSYLDGLSETGVTVMGTDEEPLPGIEQNGGFDGRSFRLPIHMGSTP